jgi:hypothetical protein
MSIRKSNLLLCAAFLLFGCSDHPNETWIAEEKIPVYDGPEGRLVFFLQPMDTCKPGMDVAGKIDMYTKVECSSGKGWVLGEKFKKISKASSR